MRRANGIHEFHRLQLSGVDAELLLDADGWPALGLPWVEVICRGGRTEVTACWNADSRRRVAVLEDPGFELLASEAAQARALLRSASHRRIESGPFEAPTPQPEAQA